MKWVVPVLHNQVDVLKLHAPFVVGSVCVGGGQQTLRHGNHQVDVMG